MQLLAVWWIMTTNMEKGRYVLDKREAWKQQQQAGQRTCQSNNQQRQQWQPMQQANNAWQGPLPPAQQYYQQGQGPPQQGPYGQQQQAQNRYQQWGPPGYM